MKFIFVRELYLLLYKLNYYIVSDVEYYSLYLVY